MARRGWVSLRAIKISGAGGKSLRGNPLRALAARRQLSGLDVWLPVAISSAPKRLIIATLYAFWRAANSVVLLRLRHQDFVIAIVLVSRTRHIGASLLRHLMLAGARGG